MVTCPGCAVGYWSWTAARHSMIVCPSSMDSATFNPLDSLHALGSLAAYTLPLRPCDGRVM